MNYSGKLLYMRTKTFLRFVVRQLIQLGYKELYLVTFLNQNIALNYYYREM